MALRRPSGRRLPDRYRFPAGLTSGSNPFSSPLLPGLLLTTMMLCDSPGFFTFDALVDWVALFFAGLTIGGLGCGLNPDWIAF